jgi:6-phosphogluconolactonase
MRFRSIAPGLLALTFAVGLTQSKVFPADPPVATGLKSGAMRVYIGTYTGPRSKGIYLFQIDPTTGALSPLGLAGEAASPSFLALHPTKRFLYAVDEVDTFGGNKTGAVSAFAIDPASGKLALLNQQPSGGTGPCHVSVDGAGKNAFVANYGSGSVEVVPIQADGRLAEPSCVVQHHGAGADPQRQEGPHAHCIMADAADQYVLAEDLGLDEVLVYRFDPAAGKLTPNDPPAAHVKPGSGPRHLAFHPGGQFAYVINEIALTITAFTYDAGRGALSEIQTISTLPAGTAANKKFSTAEIAVHPSGKFLYGSNRGHDSIAIFTIDEQTGKLTSAGHQPTQGKTPRSFGIDPTGTFLIAANQDSDNLVVFRIDPHTGGLTPTGVNVSAPSPVCVVFLPVP